MCLHNKTVNYDLGTRLVQVYLEVIPGEVLVSDSHLERKKVMVSAVK